MQPRVGMPMVITARHLAKRTYLVVLGNALASSNLSPFFFFRQEARHVFSTSINLDSWDDIRISHYLKERGTILLRLTNRLIIQNGSKHKLPKLGVWGLALRYARRILSLRIPTSIAYYRCCSHPLPRCLVFFSDHRLGWFLCVGIHFYEASNEFFLAHSTVTCP